MTNAILATYPIENIHTSPFQKRKPAFTGPEWDAFCEDVRRNGVKQPPPARPHPTLPNDVQLQDGERRLTAWIATHPGEPFAVLVSPISDREMFEFGVRLNVQRRAFNDIELADIAADYMEKFGATQTETAKLIGYKTGAGVSNLVKLRKLPPAIQQYVVDGKMPDAIARQLVAIVSVNPKAANTIADKVAAASKSEKAGVFDETARDIYYSKMIDLGNAAWSMDWLADEPKEVERDLGDGDHFLGACAGCMFNANGHCARKPCYEEKLNLWLLGEIVRVSNKVNVPVLGEDEKASVLFQDDYYDQANAQSLLNSKKEVRSTLRLTRAPKRFHYMRQVLDSTYFMLVSTDKAACEAYLAEHAIPTKTAKIEKTVNETDAQRAKRVAAEKKEQEANRAERSKMWKSKYDALWLVNNASLLVGAQLEIGGDFLKFAEALFCKEYTTHGDFGTDLEAPLVERILAEKDPTMADALRRQHIALNVFSRNSSDRNGHPDYELAHEHILHNVKFHPETKNKWGMVGMMHGFGVTLPAGWDAYPIHKTNCNCWQCGTFAGNMSEKLTQRDLKEDGWVDFGIAGVFCSMEHHDAYHKAQGADGKSQTKASAKKPAQRAAAGKTKGKRK